MGNSASEMRRGRAGSAAGRAALGTVPQTRQRQMLAVRGLEPEPLPLYCSLADGNMGRRRLHVTKDLS